MSIAIEPSPATEPACRTVYGYVLGFEGSQRSVIGIEREGQWYLAGGPVDGGALLDPAAHQAQSDSGDPLRFPPLAALVQQQLGLELVRLGGPFSVNMHPAQGDSFDISMYFLGVARGERTGGTLLSADKLPRFADACPAEAAFIRAFLETGNPLAKPTAWQRFWRSLRPN